MAATLSDLSNSQAAIDAGQQLVEDQHLSSEHQRDLHETREQLEQPPEPGTADGNNEATHAADPDDLPGYRMTADRRVGSVALQIDGDGSTRFGKPSGRSSTEMLEPIQEMEREGSSVLELGEYVWATLGSWCLDDEKDADYWADDHALLDAITLCRNVALGGNAPSK